MESNWCSVIIFGYLLHFFVSLVWWDWPLIGLTDHSPSLLVGSSSP